METLYALLALATFGAFRIGNRWVGIGLLALALAVGWFCFLHHADTPLPLSF